MVYVNKQVHEQEIHSVNVRIRWKLFGYNVYLPKPVLNIMFDTRHGLHCKLLLHNCFFINFHYEGNKVIHTRQ